VAPAPKSGTQVDCQLGGGSSENSVPILEVR